MNFYGLTTDLSQLALYLLNFGIIFCIDLQNILILVY